MFHSEKCSQQLDVQVETNDDLGPSGICTEYYLTSLLATWTVEFRAPSASLLTVASLIDALGAVDILERRNGIQRDLYKLEKWPSVSFTKLNVARC